MILSIKLETLSTPLGVALFLEKHMPIETYTTGQIDEMIRYFQGQGYQVVNLDERNLDTRKLRPGQGLGEACGDERYVTGDPTLAQYLESPAVFGGIEGRASMFARQTGKSFEDCYDWAAKIMRNEQGFEPATHVAGSSNLVSESTDLLAEIPTCAAVDFHMNRWGLTAEQVQALRDKYQVQVARVTELHTGDVFVIDNRLGVRVVQNRNLLLATASSLAQQGIEPRVWVPDVAEIAKTVLPSGTPPKVAFLR